jgi:hypothetical protein
VQGLNERKHKNHARGKEMYRRQRTNQLKIDDFMLPFGGKLKADNKWVKLAELMPWDEIDNKYKEG